MENHEIQPNALFSVPDRRGGIQGYYRCLLVERYYNNLRHPGRIFRSSDGKTFQEEVMVDKTYQGWGGQPYTRRELSVVPVTEELLPEETYVREGSIISMSYRRIADANGLAPKRPAKPLVGNYWTANYFTALTPSYVDELVRKAEEHLRKTQEGAVALRDLIERAERGEFDPKPKEKKPPAPRKSRAKPKPKTETSV